MIKFEKEKLGKEIRKTPGIMGEMEPSWWMEEGLCPSKCLESGGLIPVHPHVQARQPALSHNLTKKH